MGTKILAILTATLLCVSRVTRRGGEGGHLIGLVVVVYRRRSGDRKAKGGLSRRHAVFRTAVFRPQGTVSSLP